MGIAVVLALVLYLINLVRTMRGKPGPGPAARRRLGERLRLDACRCDNRGVPARPPVPFNAIPILAPLTAEDRAALAPLCELRAFEKGATIFEEGQPALFIHFLFLGRVKIVKAAPGPGPDPRDPRPGRARGRRRRLRAASLSRPRPSRSSRAARCRSRSGSSFSSIEKRPEITRRLLAGLTLRLMALNRRLADMTGSVEYRAARLFTTLAERAGQKRPDGVFVADPPLAAGDRRPRRNDDRDRDPRHEPLAEGGSRGNRQERIPDPADRGPREHRSFGVDGSAGRGRAFQAT